jgi:hypothetical protein
MPGQRRWTVREDSPSSPAVMLRVEARGNRRVAIGKRLRPVRSTDGAATRDYDEHDIEIRLGMGVHPLLGR